MTARDDFLPLPFRPRLYSIVEIKRPVQNHLEPYPAICSSYRALPGLAASLESCLRLEADLDQRLIVNPTEEYSYA
jgi:hypothetical protein